MFTYTYYEKPSWSGSFEYKCLVCNGKGPSLESIEHSSDHTYEMTYECFLTVIRKSEDIVDSLWYTNRY